MYFQTSAVFKVLFYVCKHGLLLGKCAVCSSTFILLLFHGILLKCFPGPISWKCFRCLLSMNRFCHCYGDHWEVRKYCKLVSLFFQLYQCFFTYCETLLLVSRPYRIFWSCFSWFCDTAVKYFTYFIHPIIYRDFFIKPSVIF